MHRVFQFNMALLTEGASTCNARLYRAALTRNIALLTEGDPTHCCGWDSITNH